MDPKTRFTGLGVCIRTWTFQEVGRVETPFNGLTGVPTYLFFCLFVDPFTRTYLFFKVSAYRHLFFDLMYIFWFDGRFWPNSDQCGETKKRDPFIAAKKQLQLAKWVPNIAEYFCFNVVFFTVWTFLGAVWWMNGPKWGQGQQRVILLRCYHFGA